jgi:CBS domain-containing protein
MAAVFFYHVAGDLTVGKPELIEFPDSASVAEAIVALRNCTECGITVWKQRPLHLQKAPESADARQDRFLGILSALDIVAHLSNESSLMDPDAALNTPVSQILVRDNSLLRQVDPATRLVDALEMLKQGVKRLLVPRPAGWRGVSKKFSILYNGKWLKPPFGDGEEPSKPPSENLCCLSREDVVRFLIGCLGALAPLPLTSIETLGAVNRQVLTIDSRSPAREALGAIGHDPPAIAVVEQSHDNGEIGSRRIVGDISAFKLWKCDHMWAAWALSTLTAGEFAMDIEDIVPVDTRGLVRPSEQTKKSNSLRQAGLSLTAVKEEGLLPAPPEKPRGPTRKFSTKCRDFMNLYFENGGHSEKGISSRPYRGRRAPLTCRPWNSLAAVMTQMLAHRATHIWVTEHKKEEEDEEEYESLVGIVSYVDILAVVTQPSNPVVGSSTS